VARKLLRCAQILLGLLMIIRIFSYRRAYLGAHRSGVAEEDMGGVSFDSVGIPKILSENNSRAILNNPISN
jgi:hypothetical protein